MAGSIFDLDQPPSRSEPELLALLGGKGANLVVMATTLGLPVPPGFTITTEVCRRYLAGGWPAGLDGELRAHVRGIEDRLGRRFGDPADPLLLSVRSGAPVSMPGMLDTILDIGLNGATTQGLAQVSGNAGFAADCARRLREMYRGIVDVDAPDDPWAQLRGAVEAVFRSWNGDRARAYRQREGIAEGLGTAVTVQAMVFGNRGADSATGVLFTRNPATGEPALYGDVLFGAQGEDVVAGTHRTEPLTVLDERLPAVATELRRYAALLERHYADLCDIEFTIEQGRLWLLQVRVGKRSAVAALRIALDMANDPDFPLTREAAVRRVAPLLADPPLVAAPEEARPAPLTVGLPASPGVASGEIAVSAEAAEAAARTGRAVILVRPETSPEDVPGMAHAAGVLTARGGLASHAAVVARGWGIPAVVGASAVKVGADAIDIDGASLPAGAVITVDGSSGAVYAGEVTGSRTAAPEATILLGWARELGISIGNGEAGPARGSGDRDAAPIDGASATSTEEATADDALRALLVKGLVSADGLALCLGSTPGAATTLLAGLAAVGLAEPTGDAWRLTGEGRLRAADVFLREREVLGQERARAALDGFVALDARVKETVSAWQLRTVDGAPIPNDHGDPAYDAGVLDQLAAIDHDAQAWLVPWLGTMPRLDAYRARLRRAISRAREGDHRFVASPRVDSYHSVWFELHEDLIRLAGKTRAEEAAAGRA